MWFLKSKDSRILRTIDIPLNYTDKDLIILKKGKYTKEELAFNKLIPEIEQAEKNLEQNIEKAYQILNLYGIKKAELKSLIYESLYIENK